MNKFLALVLVAFTTISVAQESVKLRLNYKKGDAYIMKMNMNQNMPAMTMNMKMDAKINVIDIKGDNFISEMKFTKIDMGMLQGGMEMGASTDDKDEDLDAMGKQVKAQLDQMLSVTMTSETDKLAKVISLEVVPNLPGLDQMKNQSGSVPYPEKALRVGDSWSDEKSEQGVTTKTTYTVKAISKDTVDIVIAGLVSGLGEGTISGDLKIDKLSGVPISSISKTEMKVQGQEMKINVTMTMEKAK